MALPQQAIEKLTRPPHETPGVYQNLLLLSASLFILALFVYIGLRVGFIPYLRNQIEKTDQEIEKLDQQTTQEEREQLRIFYSQLVNVRNLLRDHVVITPSLGFLERQTLPQLYFTRFAVNTRTKELSLDGLAKTLDDVATQIALFEQAPEVDRISFKNTTQVQNGEWQFSVAVTLKSEVMSGAVTPQ